MNVWANLFNRRKVKLTDPASWNLGDGSYSGKSVTTDTTLSLSTAWRCVWLRYGVLGSLPMGMFERLPDGNKREATDHWLHSLIHDSPNADQGAAEFWGGMVASIDTKGNAYAEKVRSGSRIVALQPLDADLTEPYRVPGGGRRFRTSDPRATARDLSEDDVFHLRGYTLGGDVGLSAISYGRHSLGLAMATDEAASKTFAKGLQLAGFVEMATGTKLTPEQRDDLVKLFARFAGSSNSGKVMPLDPGMKFQQFSMLPKDAQLLEARNFSPEEICRWFATPPILIGHASNGQTMFGTGVGQILLGWLTLDLNPFLKKIEQAVWKQLLTPAERPRFFAEYNREAILEADIVAKGEHLVRMAQNGFMDRNEGRRKLNLSPKPGPGADALTVQSNLVPIDLLGTQAARPTQPAPGEPI